ncbi:DEAD/DEAH box helicase [Microcoleus sp. CZ3-B4]
MAYRNLGLYQLLCAIAQTGFLPLKTFYTGTDINEYFRALTGFQPRQFPIETIRQILNRENVLLRAATGSGKTESAIALFLFSQSLNLDFPEKLIYVVSLRTLANSLRWCSPSGGLGCTSCCVDTEGGRSTVFLSIF